MNFDGSRECEIPAKGEMVALYCSVEAVQMFTEPEKGAVETVGQIRFSVGLYPEFFGETAEADMLDVLQGVEPTARRSTSSRVEGKLKLSSNR